MDAAENWQSVLSALKPDPFSALGPVGALLPAVLLGRLVAHADLAETTKLNHALFAAKLLAVPFQSSVLHPQRPCDFATYGSFLWRCFASLKKLTAACVCVCVCVCWWQSLWNWFRVWMCLRTAVR